ncbi:hypothetical protein [Larkinella punicea]|uniref:Uncharacterized protein n=1 Tax=Larkinella punicea TaxID=2315727 RepID=A0A368JD04_9BACT|nr:hypothetical protein [Larkinella punicea]RCR65548.1 hypothetical protein DUE52_31275 [Larkinella punicea]
MEEAYFSVAGHFEPDPIYDADAPQNIAYAGFSYWQGRYRDGFIRFDEVIRKSEIKLLNQIQNCYEAILSQTFSVTELRNILNRVRNKTNTYRFDPERKKKHQAWKLIADYSALADISGSESDEKLAEFKARTFFYDCLNAQLDSLDRVGETTENYLLKLHSVVEFKLESIEPEVNGVESGPFYFQVVEKVKNRPAFFTDYTRYLVKFLKQEGFLVNDVKLDEFRTLFFKKKFDVSAQALLHIRWQKSYPSLAYLIYRLRGSFIQPTDAYKIAVNRFVNKTGEPFRPKRPNYDSSNKSDADVYLIDEVLQLVKKEIEKT